MRHVTRILLTLLFVGLVASSAHALPPILECPASPGSGDNAYARAIRFTVSEDFERVELLLGAAAPDTYLFDAELRRSAGFDGDPEAIVPFTVPLAANEPFVIHWGRVVVTGAETFTLRFVKQGGPIAAPNYSVRSPDCDDVEGLAENFGAQPALRNNDPSGFRVLPEPDGQLLAGCSLTVVGLLGWRRAYARSRRIGAA